MEVQSFTGMPDFLIFLPWYSYNITENTFLLYKIDEIFKVRISLGIFFNYTTVKILLQKRHAPKLLVVLHKSLITTQQSVELNSGLKNTRIH